MNARAGERGQTVVLAYMAILTMTVLGGTLLTHGFTAQRDSELQRVQAEAFYLAEGGVEDAASRFSQDIANYQLSATTACYPVANPCGSQLLVTTFTSGATANSFIEEVEANQRTVPDPDGTNVFVKNYQVNTTVTRNGLTTTLHQIIARRVVYTFQHAVFYDMDLEWLPGPDMTLTGRVHSNSDMYLGTHSILTVDDDYVRAAGNIYNRRKDSNENMEGIVQIKQFGTNPSQFAAMAGLDSSSASWKDDSQSRWLGTVQSSVHGVTKRAVPVVGSVAPGGFYDLNANVEIVNDSITKGGVPLVEGSTMAPGTLSKTTTLYNNREGKTVKMTEINLRRLAGYYDCNGDGVEEPCYPNNLPANGLLYATRNNAGSGQEPGIRLLNGSRIDRAAGVTIVSDVPVYIQGDLNTVNKKPVSVIADAVNLLSNNWNDANSTKGLSSRVASDPNNPGSSTALTVDCAFISGVNSTTPGSYNGGLENYPRLHENWTNKTLRITGSFVALWSSQVATGKWVYGGSQYTAPNRSWNYDTSFSDGSNLPPFTPWAIEVRKGAWWQD